MEFFHHDVDFDWMGKAKYFFALSLTLLLIGAWPPGFTRAAWITASISRAARWCTCASPARRPWTSSARAWLQQGLGDSVIQQISDIANPNANEVVDLFAAARVKGTRRWTPARREILKALHATLGSAAKPASKISTPRRRRSGGRLGAQGSAGAGRGCR